MAKKENFQEYVTRTQNEIAGIESKIEAEELKKLQFKKTHPDYEGECRIPTLCVVFECLKDTNLTVNIELKTGVIYYKDIEKKYNDICKAAKATPANVEEKIAHMQAEIKSLNSEIESLKNKAANEALGDVLNQAEDVNGVKFLAVKLNDVDMNELRNLSDDLKSKIGSGVVVLASAMGSDKVNLIVTATDDIVKAGVHAGNIIKSAAPCVGGGGGGRPNMAQAGGKNASGIDELLKKAPEVLAEQL